MEDISFNLVADVTSLVMDYDYYHFVNWTDFQVFDRLLFRKIDRVALLKKNLTRVKFRNNVHAVFFIFQWK